MTAVRLAAALPCAYAITNGAWRVAALLFAVAVATDVFDGIVARRRGETTRFGALLDHATDALFVTVTLGALAMITAVTPLLPVLAITSFVQYVLDSRALSGAPLRASVLGRWNGIGYFVVVGVMTIGRALELDWPPPVWIAVAAWVLVATTVASMADRAYALWRLRG